MVEKHIFRRFSFIAVIALIGVALIGCGNSNSKTKSGAAASAGMVVYSGSDTILVSDAASKTVTVNLIAGQGTAAGGFNYNGYANGEMQIQIPSGWTAKISLIVDSGTPHSALIVPWGERQQGSNFHAAFTGSSPADYRSGIEKGDSPQTFSFAADKAGQYAVVCGVPGHDVAGMWDEFDVVDNLAAPQVLVKK